MSVEEMHTQIHGKVHGVGFRATTKQIADRFHLTGFVRNLPDGTVEIHAQGEKKNLQALLDLLQAEFRDYIQRIDTAYSPPSETFSGFTIRR